ncbi:DUF3040 domain-containing protein [Streptomyces sp. NBC_00286]|uniref:DUF3040 domain-containing protein n=1 Tax=Streptomyces sp. NBC_00286 TaxID=2975701 RepID=UPI002E2C5AE4|nr:DUF3040 domain-containing protein [Streptomyces sp. NBC_00286]
MNPEMDDGRIIAQLERRLAQDDPELAATMDALNQQFPDAAQAQSDDGLEEEEKQRNRWVTAATVFAIIAFLGICVTAVLNSDGYRSDQDPGSPRSPGTGVQSERRTPSSTPPRQRLPGRGTGLLPTDPPSAYPGGIRART